MRPSEKWAGQVVLPGLRDKPRNQSANRRPAPTGLAGHSRARPAVLMVSEIGANAEAAAVRAVAGSGRGEAAPSERPKGGGRGPRIKFRVYWQNVPAEKLSVACM